MLCGVKWWALISASAFLNYIAAESDFPDLHLVFSDNKAPLRQVTNISISLNYTGAVAGPNYDVNLTFFLQEDGKTYSSLKLNDHSLFFSSHCIKHRTRKNITVEGTYLGFSTILVNATKIPHSSGQRPNYRDVNTPLQLKAIDILIVQSDRTLTKIFNYVLMVMVILNTINMGSALDIQIVKDCLKKPIGPAVGAFCQFVVMPLLAYGIGYAMFDDTLFRLGLFVLGCSPGGNGSNFWCILLGADLNLSITMTFFSTIIALGMMPFWMYALGRTIVTESLKIPYIRLLITLAMLIGPILIGMLIKAKWEKGASILRRIIVPMTLLLVLFMLTFGIYSFWDVMTLMTGWMVLAGFMVAFAGYALGAGLAKVFRLPTPQIVAVSIETAFQNGGIALLVLQMSFDQPYNDVATIAPIAQMSITGIPLWITLIVYKTYQRVTERMGQPGKVELKVEQTVEDQKTTDVESQSPMLNKTEPKE